MIKFLILVFKYTFNVGKIEVGDKFQCISPVKINAPRKKYRLSLSNEKIKPRVVVPANYDQDKGWQYMWNENDRNHFKILNEKYSSEIIEFLLSINSIYDDRLTKAICNTNFCLAKRMVFTKKSNND
jgi:hypothetical protein